MKIFKYPVTIDGEFSVRMPKNSEILSVQLQNGKPYIWAKVDERYRNVDRLFAIIGTGNEMPVNFSGSFVGTFQMPPFVWHLFDLGEKW